MDHSESPRRPRARSDANRMRDEGPPISPSRSSRGGAGDWDGVSPTRLRSSSGVDAGPEGIRRRSSAASRRSGSIAPRTTLAQRTQGNFTMAGPEDTPQMRLANEPFVQPGYTELNPSYEQAANSRPVWGLAKPLPRVVRPGMVPTREEILQNLTSAQLPAENSQKLGLDVDPNDLESGQIEKTADPRKMAAQVEDARLQRENNLINKILNGDTGSMKPSSRMSRTSSVRGRRPSTWAPPHPDQLSTVEESTDTDGQGQKPDNQFDEPLETVPEDPVEEVLAGLDENNYDDLHPLIQDLVEDEVHNNHTTWSVIRTHHREALAEALGVFLQLTIGFCADLAVTSANAGNPNTTDWAWGFATMMGIYVSGGVSGAHFNPAITIMLWFYRGFPKRLMPEYFAAQFLGAFCAALAAYGVYYEAIHNYLLTNDTSGIINSFVTSQRETFVGPGTAFGNEFLGTALLVVTILALGDDMNAPPGAGMNSLIVGFVITTLSIAFAYQTGAALNPSRDFGPRLALLALGYGGELFRNPYWFYGPWVGAIAGAFGGAFLYDFFVFTGGESPVNYPWERTERAFRKSATKWKGRLHLGKKEKSEETVQ